MRIFLSYASQDRVQADAIHLALEAQRHSVFFDRADLPAGEEYDNRIRRAIERAHLFVFLVSPDSVDAGSYTLTELEIAQKNWKHPAGRLLPVVLRPVTLDRLPPLLKSVTLLEPAGNVTATVADAAHRLARRRRRTLLEVFTLGLALSAMIGLGAYRLLMNRAPAQETTGRDGALEVLVPAGTFVMGDDEESPMREVLVDAFYLDKHEVTTSRYAAFLKATGSLKPPDGWEAVKLDRDGELPVVGVDWHDAEVYCRWAGKRLPTEAEWEKGARGTDGRTYPWGNDEPTTAHASFLRSANGPYEGGLAAVGSHQEGTSPFGAHDLAGNASEWVGGWFSESVASGDVRNPRGPDTGEGKVIRGGGWQEPGERMKATKRFRASPDTRAEDVGFRCARDLR